MVLFEKAIFAIFAISLAVDELASISSSLMSAGEPAGFRSRPLGVKNSLFLAPSSLAFLFKAATNFCLPPGKEQARASAQSFHELISMPCNRSLTVSSSPGFSPITNLGTVFIWSGTLIILSRGM